jgi:hypothetical protein
VSEILTADQAAETKEAPRLSPIVDFETLQRISGLKQKAAVGRYLKRLKISFLEGADGAPWTTIEAINRVILDPRTQPGRPPGYTTEPNLAACHRPKARERR